MDRAERIALHRAMRKAGQALREIAEQTGYGRSTVHRDVVGVVPASNPRIKLTDEQRFQKHTTEDASGCWLWTGGINRNGYGQFYYGGLEHRKTAEAHRWAYKFYVGPIPPGLEIDHLCNVRHCARPEHLEAVTPAVNSQRAWDRNPARKAVNGSGKVVRQRAGGNPAGSSAALPLLPGSTGQELRQARQGWRVLDVLYARMEAKVTERRRRCLHCKQLVSEWAYKTSSGVVVCGPCQANQYRLHEERYQKHLADKAAEIDARTPKDHLRIARETVAHLHRNQYGHFEASAVMVDVHTLEWLIAQAEPRDD